MGHITPILGSNPWIEYLWNNPLNTALPLKQRISIVAIAILSVIVVIKAIRYIFGAKPVNTDLKPYSKEGKKATDLKPYSEEGKKALVYARKKNGDMDITKQPVAFEIFLLTTEFIASSDNFKDVLAKYKKDPWTQQEVLEAADDFMNVHFAIGCKTLEDFSAFTSRWEKETGKKISNAEALMDETSYQHGIIYVVTEAYYELRGQVSYEGNKLGFPKTISKEHAEAFYQEGTIQYKWRSLYNEFFDRLQTYVDWDAFGKQQPKFVKWMKKDTDIASFVAKPLEIKTK